MFPVASRVFYLELRGTASRRVGTFLHVGLRVPRDLTARFTRRVCVGKHAWGNTGKEPGAPRVYQRRTRAAAPACAGHGRGSAAPVSYTVREASL